MYFNSKLKPATIAEVHIQLTAIEVVNISDLALKANLLEELNPESDAARFLRNIHDYARCIRKERADA